eukprot:2441865-Rhodomonas_salina.2
MEETAFLCSTSSLGPGLSYTRNEMQETAFLVQIGLELRFLVLDFGVRVHAGYFRPDHELHVHAHVMWSRDVGHVM